MILNNLPPTVTLLCVCLTVVPGKFDVTALSPAIKLKRVLFPQLGWPMKTISGISSFLLNNINHDFAGNSSPNGYRGS